MGNGDWTAFPSIGDWWSAVGSMPGAPLKGWWSLIILKKRNARVFQRSFLQHGLVGKIKEEARCWVMAGAKHLGVITNFEE
uniref:Uncharacterized protein n=1 Tax=Setaria viridis TaxID=4556 RepID=A0A4U6TE40_SETVI|nr:hypothetical protein SEVIR_8G107900v2 [Setaria viridis]